MLRIGTSGMVAIAGLLSCVGMFLAAWSVRDGGQERAARRARLQAFVGARDELGGHPVRVLAASPAPEGLVLATWEIASRALEARATGSLLQRLVVESAVAERAAAWPVLEPIVQALAGVVGAERRFGGGRSELHQTLRVAQLCACCGW